MEYTKPLYEIYQKMEKAGSEIYRKAITGEQCAKLFANLDRSAPNIHELVDRIQFATGNDRYYTIMDILESRGVHSPYAFYRSPIKTDSPDYVFDNGNVRKMKMGR